jgi:spore photoproduct lyase
MRLGTGEFSDSLMLEPFAGYACSIIDFFKKYPDIRFEFKTKSANITDLVKTKHAGNIVVSWSVAPRKVITRNEFFSASLRERLKAARECAGSGYKIGLHFDPIIYSGEWLKLYKELLEEIFEEISPGDIAWISLGTFRFMPELKQVIEARFPDNTILNEELTLGFDNKLRYPRRIRHSIYAAMTSMLRKISRKMWIYLCMEDKEMVSSINRL